jgi:hypothetical protein
MADVKEKLAELIAKAKRSMWGKSGLSSELAKNMYLAENLIANGVRLEEKQATSDGWIPVAERLPDLIPCSAGTAYSEAVNVLTSGRKVMVAVWDGVDWLCAMDYWDAWGEVITHWTPVLLPLPEPPKGE